MVGVRDSKVRYPERLVFISRGSFVAVVRYRSLLSCSGFSMVLHGNGPEQFLDGVGLFPFLLSVLTPFAVAAKNKCRRGSRSAVVTRPVLKVGTGPVREAIDTPVALLGYLESVSTIDCVAEDVSIDGLLLGNLRFRDGFELEPDVGGFAVLPDVGLDDRDALCDDKAEAISSLGRVN